MSLEYLETILILSGAPLNPALTTSLIFKNIASGDTSVIELGTALLSPASLFANTGTTLSVVMNEIWSWTLYNILSPVIMVVGLVLFIALQIGLIYVYYKMIKEIVLRAITLWSTISGNETLNKIKSKIEKVIS